MNVERCTWKVSRCVYIWKLQPLTNEKHVWTMGSLFVHGYMGTLSPFRICASSLRLNTYNLFLWLLIMNRLFFSLPVLKGRNNNKRIWMSCADSSFVWRLRAFSAPCVAHRVPQIPSVQCMHGYHHRSFPHHCKAIHWRHLCCMIRTEGLTRLTASIEIGVLEYPTKKPPLFLQP